MSVFVYKLFIINWVQFLIWDTILLDLRLFTLSLSQKYSTIVNVLPYIITGAWIGVANLLINFEETC